MPALTQAHGPCNLRLLARRDVIETVRQCHLRNFFQRIDAGNPSNISGPSLRLPEENPSKRVGVTSTFRNCSHAVYPTGWSTILLVILRLIKL